MVWLGESFVNCLFSRSRPGGFSSPLRSTGVPAPSKGGQLMQFRMPHQPITEPFTDHPPRAARRGAVDRSVGRHTD
jgi:hypothetical protein